jgi:hypothetical protein
MKTITSTIGSLLVAVAALLQLSGAAAVAQGGPPPFGPGPGRGGFGPFGAPEPVKLLAAFDADGNKRLNSAERHKALEYARAQGIGQRRGGRGGRGFAAGPAEPGLAIRPADVTPVPASVPLYDPSAVRTIFIEFEDDDWEDQLEAFKETDIEVPATLIVDGRKYVDVDLSFRGASSFMMVPEGRKRSLNVTLDNVHGDQNIAGYNSLNLLNSHGDPTFLRAVLYLQIAREYLPAAKANWARVVINGENWGVYANVQQVDKPFLAEWFGTKSGTRWKVPGRPNGRGGLEYQGEALESYTRTYEIKGDDDPKAWRRLVELTRVLNQTPPESLERALAPLLDVDNALRFLAVEAALVNNDGYWIRASDYNLYLDRAGRFRLIPHDVNEAFPSGGGSGGGRGGFGRGGSATLDPLVGLDDPTKPLRSKLLAVPAWRARYLAHVKDIATSWLDWRVLEPIVAGYQARIAEHVRADTRKLDGFEAFTSGTAGLRAFADARRAYLLTPGAR